MKRFYKLVSVAHKPGGYAVLLDGKPVKTKSRQDLIAPTQNLADAIMQEWAAQAETIRPDTMPLTQILNTKIDRVAGGRVAMQAMVFKYFDTDLLCYRAEEPEVLAAEQQKIWDPLLTRFEKSFGHKLQTTTRLAALKHAPAAHETLRSFVQSLNDDQFTVLQLVTSISGSVILAALLVKGEVTADEIFSAIRIEERYKAALYNEEKYGPDPSQEKKDRSIVTDLSASEQYLGFLL